MARIEYRFTTGEKSISIPLGVLQIFESSVSLSTAIKANLSYTTLRGEEPSITFATSQNLVRTLTTIAAEYNLATFGTGVPVISLETLVGEISRPFSTNYVPLSYFKPRLGVMYLNKQGIGLSDITGVISGNNPQGYGGDVLVTTSSVFLRGWNWTTEESLNIKNNKANSAEVYKSWQGDDIRLNNGSLYAFQLIVSPRQAVFQGLNLPSETAIINSFAVAAATKAAGYYLSDLVILPYIPNIIKCYSELLLSSHCGSKLEDMAALLTCLDIACKEEKPEVAEAIILLLEHICCH